MIVDFYRAFEDRFRGSRDLIKSRLEVYLPFVRLLKDCHSNALVLDLGCGRGEWLELLESNNIAARGVDLDEGMLSACRNLGLEVKVQDALAELKSLPDESLAVISGFHIVEHLPFEVLQCLVQEAFRVLMPLGMLILETPNPENIVVGSSTFYLDPTHQRPIPKQLLIFLAEHYGFARVKILGLNELNTIDNLSSVSLYDVLINVSPDYAIVAQKKAELDDMQRFDRLFVSDIGVSLAQLTTRFEERLVKAELAKKEIENIKATKIWRMLSRLNSIL